MQIKRLKIDNLNGYLNLDIKFFEDVTFLIGKNGIGKTTVLNIIYKLLSFNFEDLERIRFEKISLDFKDKTSDITIEVSSKDKEIEYKSSILKNSTLEIPKYSKKINGRLSERERVRFREYISREVGEIKLSKEDWGAMYREFSSYPMFVGLSRRLNDELEDRNFIFQKRIMDSSSNETAKNTMKDYLTDEVNKALIFIRSATREIRKNESKLDSRLKEKLIESYFKYEEFKDIDLNKIKSKVKKIVEKKEDIVQVLSRLNFSESSKNSTRKLIDALEKYITEDADYLEISFIVNFTKIEMLNDLIEVMNADNEEKEKISKPLDVFLETINEFFLDTYKKVLINEIGELIIEDTRSKTSIDDISYLSSGEKQLLILFSFIMLSRYEIETAMEERLFIIDEPEISLHLSWQEKIVNSMLKEKGVQFIIATHSPDIISDHGEKCITIG